MSEEKQLIETIDENGNVIKFELYDIIEVDEQEYALLLDPEENSDEDAEVVLMKLSKDGEDYIFESIDNDEEFNKVEAYIQSLEDEDEEGDDGLTV